MVLADIIYFCLLCLVVNLLILKRVYCRESLALLRQLHRVTVILLQLCDLVILTRSQKILRSTQSTFTFFTRLCGFVALWNLRQGLPSTFKHHSYRIKTFLFAHATYVCDTTMFNLIVISVSNEATLASGYKLMS